MGQENYRVVGGVSAAAGDTGRSKAGSTNSPGSTQAEERGGNSTTFEEITSRPPVEVAIESGEVQTPKRGRGRPRKDGSTPAAAKPKAAMPQLKAADVSNLIQTTFEVIAMKGGPIWKLEKAEADKIADPLTKIISKYGWSEKVANMSDGAALTVALASVIGPRVLLSVQLKKQQKKSKEEVKDNVTGQRLTIVKPEGTNQGSGRKVNGPATAAHDGQNPFGDLLPPIFQ